MESTEKVCERCKARDAEAAGADKFLNKILKATFILLVAGIVFAACLFISQI